MVTGTSSIPAKVIPFAMLNHRLEPGALAQWITQIGGLGVDGIFLHPRIGLRTPYLSKAWMDRVGECLEAGQAAGLEVWLYDEFPYPSGPAGGRLLAGRPEWEERHLAIHRLALEAKGEEGEWLIAPVETGELVEAFVLHRESGRFRRVTEEVGVFGETWFRTPWDSRFYYDPQHSHLYPCPRSGCYRPHWAWAGRAQEGEELVALLAATDPTQRAGGPNVDVSNPDVADAFLASTHERYAERFGAEFGGAIPGIFTDEPKYHFALPWSRTIAAAWGTYQRDRSALLALVHEFEGAAALRREYREVCARLFEENWCRRLSLWCRGHGLAHVGHISPEEAWTTEVAFCGSILKNLRHFEIPGCDLIIPAVGDAAHPVLNFTPIMACSAAAQAGRAAALCELFAASDYSFNAATMKRIGDWLTLFGINCFVPHGLFYSLDGDRKYDAPPTFSAPSLLEPFLGPWSDAVRANASRLGPQGVVVEAVFARPLGRMREALNPQGPEGQTWSEIAMSRVQRLLERGILCHWVDDDELESLRVDAEGRIVVGAAAYRYLFYLEGTLDARGEAALERLAAEGAWIVYDPEGPEAPISGGDGQVRACRNRAGEWFLVNLSDAPVSFYLHGRPFRLEGAESRWAEETPVAPDESEALEGWDVCPESLNWLLLRHWELDGQAAAPGPLYALERRPKGPMRPCSLGELPAQMALPEPITLNWHTRFSLDAPLDLRLVLEEGALRGDWTLSLDDRPLGQGIRETVYDRFNKVVPLGTVAAGEHTLHVCVVTDQADGGLLDVCRLQGAFDVLDAQRQRLGAPTPLPPDLARWTAFPHYSGRFFYRKTLSLALAKGERLFLRCDRPLPHQAEVWANGSFAGVLAWAPWQVELTQYLHAGPVELELRVSNSLSNLMTGEGAPGGIGEARFRLCRVFAPISQPLPALS